MIDKTHILCYVSDAVYPEGSMVKLSKKFVIISSVVAMVGGISLAGLGLYIQMQVSIVSNSFMGQMSMMSGRLNRQQVANTLARSENFMIIGVVVAVLALIALLVAIFWKKNSTPAT